MPSPISAGPAGTMSEEGVLRVVPCGVRARSEWSPLSDTLSPPAPFPVSNLEGAGGAFARGCLLRGEARRAQRARSPN